MSHGIKGGKVAAMLIKARGGFYVAGKGDSPEQAAMRQQMKIEAREKLARIGIDYRVGRVK